MAAVNRNHHLRRKNPRRKYQIQPIRRMRRVPRILAKAANRVHIRCVSLYAISISTKWCYALKTQFVLPLHTHIHPHNSTTFRHTGSFTALKSSHTSTPYVVVYKHMYIYICTYWIHLLVKYSWNWSIYDFKILLRVL